jgi:broad specificity phosphatase PhoE
MKRRCFFVAKIYLVRHGESVANTKGIYQGQTYNTDLSPLGIKQAEALGKRLEHEHIAAMYVSPLQRTKQTAQAIFQYHDTLPMVTSPAIIETNHGNWEGKRVSYIQKKWPDVYQTWITHPDRVVFPGGETFGEIETRVLCWWRDLACPMKGNVVVVSHDNIIRILLIHVLHMNRSALWKFQLQPTGITTIERNENTTVVVCINDTHHLEGLEANLANHAL